MNISRLAAAIVACALTSPIVSATDESVMSMDMQLSEMQKDMNALLLQIAKLRQQSQLQKNMNELQRQIEELQSTSDPKERQRLIEEHLQTLQEHMKMIRSMSEPETGSESTKEVRQSAPGGIAGPRGMLYGPATPGIPGGMMYGPGGPGMMAGPRGYPGRMPGPDRTMGTPPGSTGLPRYR